MFKAQVHQDCHSGVCIKLNKHCVEFWKNESYKLTNQVTMGLLVK